jgi:predicted RNase H-like nuclease (RuvC/YqgF family)
MGNPIRTRNRWQVESETEPNRGACPTGVMIRAGDMDDQTMFDLFESLKREIDSLRQELRPMRAAMERIEARLARQGGLIQGGVRQVARLATWSEDIDQLAAERDGRIEDLTRRVERLEGKEPGAQTNPRNPG